MDATQSKLEDLNINVPSFAKRELYDFDSNKKTFEIYQELSKISEEIEQCRLRNC